MAAERTARFERSHRFDRQLRSSFLTYAVKRHLWACELPFLSSDCVVFLSFSSIQPTLAFARANHHTARGGGGALGSQLRARGLPRPHARRRVAVSTTSRARSRSLAQALRTTNTNKQGLCSPPPAPTSTSSLVLGKD
eukprot:scaffold6879_cov26-Tisochrysis_lutea.AAC.1